MGRAVRRKEEIPGVSPLSPLGPTVPPRCPICPQAGGCSPPSRGPPVPESPSAPLVALREAGLPHRAPCYPRRRAGCCSAGSGGWLAGPGLIVWMSPRARGGGACGTEGRAVVPGLFGSSEESPVISWQGGHVGQGEESLAPLGAPGPHPRATSPWSAQAGQTQGPCMGGAAP